VGIAFALVGVMPFTGCAQTDPHSAHNGADHAAHHAARHGADYAAHHAAHHGGAAPKNIIIVFGDGAAATQWEFGRYTSRALRDKPFAVTDVVFKTGVLIGSGDRSRSSSSGSVVELGAAR
jgi:hypothetical protein